jgi:hypothetical protein
MKIQQAGIKFERSIRIDSKKRVVRRVMRARLKNIFLIDLMFASTIRP